MGSRDGTARTARADIDGLVVVCAKCRKRQDLGRRELGRSLKRALKRQGSGRRLRVVETGCLGPCPKRLVAVATPAHLGQRRVLLLDPALPEEAVAQLAREAVAGPGRAAEGKRAQEAKGAREAKRMRDADA